MNLIDWVCDTCHADTGGRGAILIDYADIREAESARKTWHDRQASADYMRWDAADALAPPRLAMWRVECHSCAGACESSYWVDLEQARTVADLDRWTEHLSGKTWFNASNWLALVTSVVETQRSRSKV
jgi:hypothetical protein